MKYWRFVDDIVALLDLNECVLVKKLFETSEDRVIDNVVGIDIDAPMSMVTTNVI
jgi:hypothetical protein